MQQPARDTSAQLWDGKSAEITQFSHRGGSVGRHVQQGINCIQRLVNLGNGKKWLCDTEIVQLSGFSTGNLFWDPGGGLLNFHSWKELLMISLHGYQCPGPNTPYASDQLTKQMHELIKEAEPVFSASYSSIFSSWYMTPRELMLVCLWSKMKETFTK